MSGSAVISPTTVDTTLIQDGQPSGAITPSDIRQMNDSLAGVFATQVSGNYTFVSGAAGTLVEQTSGTAATWTVPTLPAGTSIGWCQYGGGQVTFVSSGVILRTASSLTSRAQYSQGTVRWRTTAECVVGGDLTPAAASYYVAANGNDTWSGLLAAPNGGSTDGPFLTLTKAQTASHSGAVKLVTVRAGTHLLAANFAFTASDNGCTWLCYPNEVAIIDGNSSAYYLTATSSNLTIYGLVFQNLLSDLTGYGNGGVRFASCSNLTFRWNTVQSISTGWMMTLNAVTNSLVDSNTYTGQSPGNYNGTANGYSALRLVNGCSNNIISHNYLTSIAGGGTAQETGSSDPVQNNNTFDRNLYNGCCQSVTDLGAIYAYDVNGTSTGTMITNNVVTNNGTNSNIFSVRGIYLDNGQSHTTVTGNLLYNHIGVIVIQLAHTNTGVSNTASNNVFAISVMTNSDPGDWYGTETMGYQGGGAGNSFTKNIIYYYSTCYNPTWTTFGTTPTAYPTCSGNMYYSATAATIYNTGSIIDANPYNLNPLFNNPSSGDFSLQAGSPAYADLSWTNLPTNQGPLAYAG